MKTSRRGQSTLEYAVIIAIVAAGLLAIKIYMGRGLQGKLREATDQIGEQYSARNTTSIINTTQSNTLETVESFGYSKNYIDTNYYGKDADGTVYPMYGQGTSYYKVNTPATVIRKTQTGGEEKITTNATTGSEGESLF
jgi:Flp pilus assembly pilin Flp